MAEVELAQDALIVHVEGMDQLFALRSRLEVPLSHVAGAEADPQEARRRWHGIMEREIWVPGPITAGTFYQEVELAAAIAGLHALQSGRYGRGEISRRLRSSAELRQGGYEVWSPY